FALPAAAQETPVAPGAEISLPSNGGLQQPDEPGWLDRGGAVDQWFGDIVYALGYLPFYNLLEPLGASEPIVDEAGQPVIGPTGAPVTPQLPAIVLWLIIGAVFFTLSWR